MKKIPAILFFDNTSADNLAMADAATRASSSLDVKLAIISGRAAHSDPTASIEERDGRYSAIIHRLNTQRMAGYLQRAGRNILVFEGEKVYRTQLRTVIPHDRHANEFDYDLHDDRSTTQISGDFASALGTLRHIISKLEPSQKLMVLVGGPCTELAIILRYCPDIAARLGTVVMQAGDFATDESTNLRGGKGNSFNGAVDAVALRDVLLYHEGDVYILPSNITKQPEVALTVDEIKEVAREELAAIYEVHAARRGGSTFIHDLGVVMLAEQLMDTRRETVYQYEPVAIEDVPFDAPLAGEPERRGTILIQSAMVSNRFVVTSQDITGYRQRVAEYLQS
jgi:inosine-uridine nucleoside N-ribohydrolase